MLRSWWPWPTPPGGARGVGAAWHHPPRVSRLRPQQGQQPGTLCCGVCTVVLLRAETSFALQDLEQSCGDAGGGRGGLTLRQGPFGCPAAWPPQASIWAKPCPLCSALMVGRLQIRALQTRVQLLRDGWFPGPVSASQTRVCAGPRAELREEAPTAEEPGLTPPQLLLHLPCLPPHLNLS